MDFRNAAASLTAACYPPRKADESHKRIAG